MIPKVLPEVLNEIFIARFKKNVDKIKKTLKT